ncbi:MAG: ATP-binding cassette domain-containing protein, partial [Desulfobulbaceae bacterium]|nr:ATP-binding cassette domain-containing protein [Desulfobulbaceae bacterium]
DGYKQVSAYGAKMPSDELILKTKNLSKDFGALRAVNDVTLGIGSGVHSIIGPNGAGKTTLFNLVTGFLKPTEGKIFYQGKEITNLAPYEISKGGMARSFQITSIFHEQTVYKNVRLAVQSRLKASYNFLISFKYFYMLGELVGRRSSSWFPIMVRTFSPRWLKFVYLNRIMPRSTRDFDGRISMTSPTTWSVSPGRTGRSQRTSSIPGEPRLQLDSTPVSRNRRKVRAMV